MIQLRKTAWVTGIKLSGYMLRVSAIDPDASTFYPMNQVRFANLRRAHDAANAIRDFVRLQRARRAEAAARKHGI